MHIQDRRLGRLLGALAIGTLLSSAAIGTASAAASATIVRGVQLAAGTCENGGYAMTGALEGCWWIDTFNTTSDPTKSHYRATGTEHFTGCLDGTVCGTFFTTYSYTSKTDGPWPTSAEIHGRCHHPVTGGVDGFAGASGEITFHDVVNISPPDYPYWGNLRVVAGGPSTAVTSAAGATALDNATSTTC